jgi:energy-coupling factor transporter transmembrane protein EcfT
VYGLTVILRWLMVISKIKRRITQSQIIRGKKVSTNIWKCIKDQFFTSYLILNIATYKTKAILHAMKMKGFNIDVQRYYSAGYNVEIRDYITLTVLVFLNAVCLFLRWNGYGIIE